jgi:protein AbiQ
MKHLKIYSVSDRYIDYLRADSLLKKFVFDHKASDRKHERKYIGVAFETNGYNYFIPFASPKESDYINQNGMKKIRSNTISIIRMTTDSANGTSVMLLGTLKLNNMIPIPKSELTYYDIGKEKDLKYKDVVFKEYEYIKRNSKLILNNAAFIYHQKEIEKSIKNKPGYLDFTVPFQYAEQKCLDYCKMYDMQYKPTLAELTEWQDKAEEAIQAASRKKDTQIQR